MTDLPEIAALSQIAPGYDALFCDVWGVVHDGRQPYDEGCAALQRFRAEYGPVILLTNSPRPSSQIPAQFAEIGVPDGICDAIVTSGDVTRAALAQRAPGRAWKIGPARDEPIYDGLELEFVPMEEADFISCTGLHDDRTESPEDYREALQQAAGRGLTMVCANPDIVVHVGDRLIPCAGALAQIFAEYGGEVVLAGKPHAPIYEMAFARLEEIAGAAPDRARVLAVGDGAATDLAGANAAGIDALFIAGGIHREWGGGAGAPDPARVRDELAQAGVRARWLADTLSW